MARIANQTQARDARLKRLAENIDALAEKDEGFLRRAREVAALRQAAAADLYAICADFVGSVNRLLARTGLELDPPGKNHGARSGDLTLRFVRLASNSQFPHFHAAQPTMASRAFSH